MSAHPTASSSRCPCTSRCARAALTGALAWLLGSASQAADGSLFVHGGGLSHHFEETRAEGRTWEDRHPGTGVEHRQRLGEFGDWDRRATLGIFKDSRGVWSGYGGAAWMRRWQWGRQAETGLGVGTYAFYKSKNWRGDRVFIPALVPTASLGLLDNKVGLNLLYVPSVAGINSNMPAVIFMQLVVRGDAWR